MWKSHLAWSSMVLVCTEQLSRKWGCLQVTLAPTTIATTDSVFYVSGWFWLLLQLLPRTDSAFCVSASDYMYSSYYNCYQRLSILYPIWKVRVSVSDFGYNCYHNSAFYTQSDEIIKVSFLMPETLNARVRYTISRHRMERHQTKNNTCQWAWSDCRIFHIWLSLDWNNCGPWSNTIIN